MNNQYTEIKEKFYDVFIPINENLLETANDVYTYTQAKNNIDFKNKLQSDSEFKDMINIINMIKDSIGIGDVSDLLESKLNLESNKRKDIIDSPLDDIIHRELISEFNGYKNKDNFDRVNLYIKNFLMNYTERLKSNFKITNINLTDLLHEEDIKLKDRMEFIKKVKSSFVDNLDISFLTIDKNLDDMPDDINVKNDILGGRILNIISFTYTVCYAVDMFYNTEDSFDYFIKLYTNNKFSSEYYQNTENHKINMLLYYTLIDYCKLGIPFDENSLMDTMAGFFDKDIYDLTDEDLSNYNSKVTELVFEKFENSDIKLNADLLDNLESLNIKKNESDETDKNGIPKYSKLNMINFKNTPENLKNAEEFECDMNLYIHQLSKAIDANDKKELSDYMDKSIDILSDMAIKNYNIEFLDGIDAQTSDHIVNLLEHNSLIFNDDEITIHYQKKLIKKIIDKQSK